jgi:DNA polymerase-3 subunit epsilon/CBS domain-containing protein
MPEIRPTTPLAAIDAVVIDTETTGLDARHARVVQIAGFVLDKGVLASDPVIDTLVDPGIAIPQATTAIHGISDQDVAGKPRFAEIAAALKQSLDGRLVVGHSLGYDLAVLRREHEAAGIAWQPPPALDVRPLARLAAPSLADHGLDRLCDWLGIAISGRHTARGDALATAEVLQRLIPLLREKGIRTVAEATAAIAKLSEQDARASRGLMLVGEETPPAVEALPALDTYAYRHRARDVMSAPPLVIPAETTIERTLALILEKGTSSVFVTLTGGTTGIVTERDLLRVVAAAGGSCLSEAVFTIAKSPVHGVDVDDFVYRAIGRMARLGVRHLAVRDRSGAVVGALTPRNLLRDRAMEAIVIGDAIAAAATPAELASAWGMAAGMASALRRQGVGARMVAATLSSEIQAITRRAAQLAEAEMHASGAGAPPVAYAVMVLGSAGRGESLLAADQDNAIVYAEGGEGSPADRWFEALAVRMNQILDEAGIVLCKGDVMARNRVWRLSREDWKAQVEGWIRRQRPLDLLNVDIFFDATPVHGATSLADDVLSFARERAGATPSFLMMLTELARQWRSPMGFFGSFQKVDGRVDLKKGGLMPIFTGARVMALRHAIAALPTHERLEAVKALGIGAPADFDAVIEAQDVLLGAILDQQIEDARQGVPLSPRVSVDRLDAKARARLKSAVAGVDTMLALLSEGRL